MSTVRLAAISAALALCLAPGAVWALQEGENAPSFKLMDQFGKTWELSNLRDRVVVVVAANRDSGRAMGPWVENLKKTYGSRVQLLGLIQLDGIPGFARGMARSRIRKETSDPIMVDFEGSVGKAYAVTSKYPVVTVIDKMGVVREVQKTEYADGAYKTVAGAIDRALAK